MNKFFTFDQVEFIVNTFKEGNVLVNVQFMNKYHSCNFVSIWIYVYIYDDKLKEEARFRQVDRRDQNGY